MSDNTNDKVDGGVAGSGGAPAGNWERDVLEKLVFATLQEQRAPPLGHLLQGLQPADRAVRPVGILDYNSADDGEPWAATRR
jgi:protease-4